MTEKAPTWLLILGWITAILGGLIGIGIGGYLRFGKVVGVNGEKVPRYDEGTRRQGLMILLLGVAMTILWRVLAANMR
jgi:hypothetical protein